MTRSTHAPPPPARFQGTGREGIAVHECSLGMPKNGSRVVHEQVALIYSDLMVNAKPLGVGPRAVNEFNAADQMTSLAGCLNGSAEHRHDPDRARSIQEDAAWTLTNCSCGKAQSPSLIRIHFRTTPRAPLGHAACRRHYKCRHPTKPNNNTNNGRDQCGARWWSWHSDAELWHRLWWGRAAAVISRRSLGSCRP